MQVRVLSLTLIAVEVLWWHMTLPMSWDESDSRLPHIARSPNGMASVLHTEKARVRFPTEQFWIAGGNGNPSAF